MKQSSNCLQLLSFDLASSKFTLHQEGLDFIEELRRPLAIVTVAGSICSGKSYLLNQILG